MKKILSVAFLMLCLTGTRTFAFQFPWQSGYGLMTTNVHTYAAGDIVASADLNSIQQNIISTSTSFQDHANNFKFGSGWDGGTLANNSTSHTWFAANSTRNFQGMMNVHFYWTQIVSGGGQIATLQNSSDGSNWFSLASTQSIETTLVLSAGVAIAQFREIDYAGTFTSNRTCYRIIADEGVLFANGAHYAYTMFPTGSW